MAIETKIVITLSEDSDPVLLAQIIELAKQADGVVIDDPNEPVEPPVEEEFFWDNNHTMDQAVAEVSGLPVAYVRVKKGGFLWCPDDGDVLEPSQPIEFSADTATARTYFKDGQIIVVYKLGYSDPEDRIYNKTGLEHITNIESEQRPLPLEFDGGTRGFLVMWEQRIDGRDLREHPDRFRPLIVKADDVTEVMDF